jgi:hypothetical protein
MERLEDFLDHEDPIIVKAAQELIVLKDGLYNGDLSDEQFEELANDLLEIEEVRKMSELLDRKIKILQTFNIMKKIVGVIAK